MTQLGNLVGKTFASISGTYRIVRDTKPAERDYQHGDERAIEYIDGHLAGETIEQVFAGPSSTGGWIDRCCSKNSQKKGAPKPMTEGNDKRRYPGGMIGNVPKFNKANMDFVEESNAMAEGRALTCVNCKRDIRLSGSNWVDSQDFANCKAGPHVPIASLTTPDKRINELVKALEAVEWVADIVDDFCPWCKGVRPTHNRDCKRQAALTTAGGKG